MCVSCLQLAVYREPEWLKAAADSDARLAGSFPEFFENLDRKWIQKNHQGGGMRKGEGRGQALCRPTDGSTAHEYKMSLQKRQ